jgi:Glycosyl hydrolase family 76
VSPDDAYSARAMRAYAGMQARFHRADGIYRRDGLLGRAGVAAHLWPFVRALVATLDLAGVPPELTPGFDGDAETAQRLAALERYWDPTAQPPAYASDVIGSRSGGDRYYDDNAWVGLALIQLERMRPGSGQLARAEQLFEFAVGGWDSRPDVPHAGGVFWVEQGRGTGRANHDRNAVSNGPNAQLGLHLAELTGRSPAAGSRIGARQMYEWVTAELDEGATGDTPGTGLFWDKWRGDGSLDRTLWSYNQGSMIGANVLLGRDAAGADRAAYIGRAEAIARRALAHYAGDRLAAQPYAFNAIFFRNLLLLCDATADAALRADVLAAMRSYADRPEFSSHATTLLDLSAVVQILALLAWDPADYRRLA